MLTETQIQKLRALSTSQKFGRLIEDAIKTWTSENIGVAFGNFGVKKSGKHFELEGDRKCCLIGAALLDKERLSVEDYSHTIKRIYGIEDAYSIWTGFDNNDERRINDEYLLGLTVRKILLSDDLNEK